MVLLIEQELQRRRSVESSTSNSSISLFLPPFFTLHTLLLQLEHWLQGQH